MSAAVTQQTLPSVNTPLSPDNAAKALSQAYQMVVRQTPSEGILNLLIGQSALETANWGNGINKAGNLYGLPDYNFGGIKATPSDPFVQNFTTTEGDGANATTVVLRFAAYQSAADGAAAYVRVLARHPKWWAGLQTGTPEGFVNALRCGVYGQPVTACQGDYFTGNKDTYLAGLKSRIAQHPGLAARYINAPLPVPVSAPATGLLTFVGAVGLLAGAAAYLLTEPTYARANPTMLLFSYGSNHPAQLAQRLGHPVEGTTAAYLPGYIRVFRGYSRTWGGGVASLEPKKGARTFGYVAPVTDDDLHTLDRYEGVAQGKYRREVVRTSAGVAIAYVSNAREFRAPSPAYLYAVAQTVGSFWSGSRGAVRPSDFPVRALAALDAQPPTFGTDKKEVRINTFPYIQNAVQFRRNHGDLSRYPVRDIPLYALVAQQKFVDRSKVRRYIEQGWTEPILVARYRDRWAIVDGHHRAYAASMLGLESIQARVKIPRKELQISTVR